MPDDDAARLTALEERYCHQAQLIDELNDALIAAQRLIDRLGARVARLEATTRDHHAQLTGPAPDERPPHY